MLIVGRYRIENKKKPWGICIICCFRFLRFAAPITIPNWIVNFQRIRLIGFLFAKNFLGDLTFMCDTNIQNTVSHSISTCSVNVKVINIRVYVHINVFKKMFVKHANNCFKYK